MTLRAHGLSCERGERELFRGVDAAADAGEALWVRGSNGSGKTSLLRILCGLAPATQGTVEWRGRDIRRLREDFRADLLFVGHAAAVKDDLSAAENLRLGARLAGWRGGALEVQHALEQVGLSPVADLPAAQLSQGQRKRLSLARLHLPPVPPLVVLDEPFNALDPASGEQLRDTLQRHLAQGGTLVYTTHQPQRLPAARLRVLDLHGVH